MLRRVSTIKRSSISSSPPKVADLEKDGSVAHSLCNEKTVQKSAFYSNDGSGLFNIDGTRLTLKVRLVQSTPAMTERRGNAMLFSPAAMGVTGFSDLPSATHFSISPATCQGQAAVAVAAFAGIQRQRPQAPGIIRASQFAHLQKILSTA